MQFLNLGAKSAKEKSGATAIEYGLIVALIAVAIIGTLTVIGGGFNEVFLDTSDVING